jgi:hypothetical protein
MFKIIVFIIAVAIAAFLVFLGFKPNKFHFQRSIAIKAFPEKIFPLISDFHNWAAWSPYEKTDPAMKRTYSGAASGAGAAYAWAGNAKVGQGHMAITSVTVPAKIVIDLAFEKPMKAHNTAEFTLDREGDSTLVTWAMYGPNSYVMKVMHTFFNMDKMLGKDFSIGLANLKSVAEK